MASGLKTIVETLRDLFFPLHCAGCRTALETGWLCPACAESLAPIRPPRCEVCSEPFDGAMETFTCPNCRGRAFHFECAVAVLRSRGLARELIHRLKYNREIWLARPLGNFLERGLEDPRLQDWKIDAIVPVPLHPLRRREREFNQSELLARELSRRLGRPLSGPLKRVRHTVTQTHFDRRQRMQNLRDAFALRQNVPVQGQNLLLVDDVFTTGSTLDECTRVLLAAGARSVRALTVARG